jgi:leader peptidase (prepilin peptidase)/N-methyltransferase
LSVELVLAAVFAILASQHIDLLALLAFCWLAALGGALALIDLASQRLPNVLSVPTYLGVVGLLSAQALVSHDGTSLVRALAAGFGLVLFFLMLAVASRGGVGMGDVKLAASIGTALAWISVDALVAGVLLGLLLAGAAGLVAIISGRLRWKQAFAFGPFLVTGAVIILAASQWVA